MIHHAVSLVGFVIFAGLAWLLSTNRRRIAWKTIAWGVALQLLIGLIIFRLPVSQRVLLWLNDAVLVLLNASKSGSVFLFGPLAASPGEPGSVGFILVFQVLPVVIFFAAFTAMLYHLRVLQVFVRLFARLFHRTMRISGAESLSSAANIFVGIESALVVRPYLETDDAVGVAINIDYGHGHGGIERARSLRGISRWRLSTDRGAFDLGFDTRDSCVCRRVQAVDSGNRDARDTRGRSS